MFEMLEFKALTERVNNVFSDYRPQNVRFCLTLGTRSLSGVDGDAFMTADNFHLDSRWPRFDNTLVAPRHCWSEQLQTALIPISTRCFSKGRPAPLSKDVTETKHHSVNQTNPVQCGQISLPPQDSLRGWRNNRVRACDRVWALQNGSQSQFRMLRVQKLFFFFLIFIFF